MKPSTESAGDDAVVFRVAQLFLGARGAGLSTSAIAEQVNREFPRQRELTREAVYPLIGEAVQRGFLKLVPPVNQQLADKVSAKYPNLATSALRVVETAGPHDNAKVAVVAAEPGRTIDLLTAGPADFTLITTNGLSNKESAWFRAGTK